MVWHTHLARGRRMMREFYNAGSLEGAGEQTNVARGFSGEQEYCYSDHSTCKIHFCSSYEHDNSHSPWNPGFSGRFSRLLTAIMHMPGRSAIHFCSCNSWYRPPFTCGPSHANKARLGCRQSGNRETFHQTSTSYISHHTSRTTSPSVK